MYFAIIHASFTLTNLVYRVLSAVINGVTYRKGTVVICGIEDDTPLFGRIAEVIVTPHQECFFVVSALLTVAFQHHYNAYEVVPTDSTVVYHHRQLFIIPSYVRG